MARFALAALAAALALPAAAAPRTACKGTVDGPVKAAFTCAAGVTTRGDQMFFTIESYKQLDKLPGFAPGGFELLEKPRAGTWTLETLGMGRASVAVEGGALYTATKTTGQRGEVTLTFTSARPDPKVKGNWVVHGTYRAKLLPAGSGRSGEVVVEAQF